MTTTYKLTTNDIFKDDSWSSGLYGLYAGDYLISISREDGGWQVWAEDHEPKEISIIEDSPLFFTSKKKASEVAVSFANFFVEVE